MIGGCCLSRASVQAKQTSRNISDAFPFADNIETNVRNVAQDTRGASVQLTEAHAYQRKAGRRMLCLLLIFIIVITIVLLAVSNLQAIEGREVKGFEAEDRWRSMSLSGPVIAEGANVCTNTFVARGSALCIPPQSVFLYDCDF